MATDSPIFDFNETTRIASAWFVAWAETDWLAIVYQQDGAWMGRYRFRYYTDRVNRLEAFNTGDTKSTYSIRPKEQADEPQRLVEVFTKMAVELAHQTEADLCEQIDVNGSVDDYLAAISKKPWTHVKVMPAEPKAAM